MHFGHLENSKEIVSRPDNIFMSVYGIKVRCHLQKAVKQLLTGKTTSCEHPCNLQSNTCKKKQHRNRIRKDSTKNMQLKVQKEYLQGIDGKIGCQMNPELLPDLYQEKNSHFVKCLHYLYSYNPPQPPLP